VGAAGLEPATFAL